jgi:hypothetical protein
MLCRYHDGFEDGIKAAAATTSTWKTCGYPHHFIGGEDCRYSIVTYVAEGRYMVSTVGDYHPGSSDHAVSMGADDDDEKFETMVFLCDPTRLNADGEPEVADWAGVHMERYATSAEASAGHVELCRVFDQDRASYTLEHSGVVLTNVHSIVKCLGEPCTIHNRSAHHMRVWPQHWRDDRGIMERTCPHGVGHPDPDSPWPPDSSNWIHGCDGCCVVAGDLR